MFFGRDAAITHLEQAVQRHSLTALVGASGCGKSSVVLAGLAPTGERQWRSVHNDLGDVDLRPDVFDCRFDHDNRRLGGRLRR
jgi:ABC-type transport system involved in cytochrome bd biosynthesis fused ATPase/permease subunit